MSVIFGTMVPHPPLILPDVGRGEERGIQDTIDSYRKVASDIEKLSPETVVITSPHATMFRDYFHISPGSSAYGDMGRFRAPGAAVEALYDEELVKQISGLCEEERFPAGPDGERDKSLDHGTLIPLWFLREAYRKAGRKPDYKVVRIGLSGLSLQQHYRFGVLIEKAIEALDRKAVFIASGDLSHRLMFDGPYGFNEQGPVYDNKIMDVMGRGAFSELTGFDEKLLEEAAECGHRSFTIMGGTFDGQEVEAEKLSYEGPFGVGYGVCEFRCPKRERHYG